MKYDEFLKQMRERRHQRPRHIESGIQQQMVTWFRAQYPGYVVAAIPNGGYRNAAEAAIMKREGVLAGFSDLIVIADRNVLFVEVKTRTGRQSALQKEFERKVNNLGFEYIVCRSLPDFVQSVGRWLKARLAT